MPSRKQTIKAFAHDYFLRTNFVDIHGRKIGYDYDFILDEIKAAFPGARTSRRWLQDMAYVLNRDTRLPVRRRSRPAMAEEYAKTLLLRRKGVGSDYYYNITRDIKEKFAEQHIGVERLRSLEIGLRNQGFTIPERL